MLDQGAENMKPSERFTRSLESYLSVSETEKDGIGDGCGSILLHHKEPVPRAYVLLHGLTNCPAQFARIAAALHGAGANVYVPLAEGHGRADGSPEGLTSVDADSLERWTSAAVDLGAGLGTRLTVAGFSFGGVCTAWAARHCSEVDEAVMIAPAFLPYSYPVAAARWLPLYARAMPERYLWWDPVRKGSAAGSPYSYRRLSRRGLGAVFELGQRAWREKPRRTTELEHAVLVLNGGDLAISAPAAKQAFKDAVAPIAAHAEVRRIELRMRYPHDFIDPLGMIGEREPEARAWLLPVIGARLEGAPWRGEL